MLIAVANRAADAYRHVATLSSLEERIAVTTVQTADGTTWTSITVVDPVTGGSHFLVRGDQWDRVERGSGLLPTTG